MADWGACSRCGSELDVVAVTYRVGESTETAPLCPSCKSNLLMKTRVRRAPRETPSRRALVAAGTAAAVAVLASLGLSTLGGGSSSSATQPRCVTHDGIVACVSNS